MATTTAAPAPTSHVTVERREYASAWGGRHASVLNYLTCRVCGGHGRIGGTPAGAAAWAATEWHPECAATITHH